MSINKDSNLIKDINNKTKKGFKWILIINILAAPIQFLISLMLGRVSPELLGKYGFLEILLNLVITVGMFGGPNLMIRYIPSISKENVALFISKYIKYSFLLLISIFILFGLLNQLSFFDLEFLLGKSTPPLHFVKWIVLWSVLYLLYYILNSSQSALLRLKDFAIASKMYFFIMFIMLIVFYFYGVRSWELIFFSSIIAIIFSIVFILKKNSKDFIVFKTKEYKFPKGFWRYSVLMYISTFLTFLYEKLDQIIILFVYDLKYLGIYFGIMKIAFISKMIPQIINRGLISSLSSLIQINALDEIKAYYNKIINANYLICALISIVTILFSDLILNLFGSTFSDYRLLLLLFVITAFIDFYDTLNVNILIVKGEDKKVLTNTILKNITFLISVFILLPIFDLEGLVLARIISLIFGVVYTKYSLNRVNYYFVLPIKTLFIILLIVLVYYSGNFNIFIETLSGIIAIAIILVFNKVELLNIIKKTKIWK
ncbi:lipopolysaccharide biosynthesis protein [Lacinutrix algicola]|uniref:lipopolysaccharide biosynthesis protein n=1 Tax=Lacinutrix algicola TaxID=342954 RepID=UPI0006E3A3FF|nr:hypothetical protein [Lacinutrix algicola]